MIRTSRSPIFNQSHDFSCFLTDADGTLVSQADGIPIHTGGGGFAVRAAAQGVRRPDRGGDAFLLNDPYVAGGNHLPDWVVARPVFAGDTWSPLPATARTSPTSAAARRARTIRRRPRSSTRASACRR